MPARTLDDALEESTALYRRYKAAKRKDREQLCTDPIYGERLRVLFKTLREFTQPDDADRMIEYITRECRRWLRAAPVDIRYAVLEEIDNQCIAIRVQAGLPPFHDPIPPEEDNVFFKCKQKIGL